MPTFEQAAETVRARSVLDRKSGCRVWSGCAGTKRGKFRGGYGLVRVDKMVSVHRVAYESEYGPIPEGAHVLHRCDNRLCTEPTHLYLGTNTSNIVDKCSRDRSGKKLCIAKVKRMRRMLGKGVPRSKVSKLFGVHTVTVGRIERRERWAHI